MPGLSCIGGAPIGGFDAGTSLGSVSQTLGNFTLSSAAALGTQVISGKEYYLPALPQKKKKKVSAEIQETRELIDHAQIERARIKEQLLAENRLKAAEARQLEYRLHQIAEEILRLQIQLRALEAQKKRQDNEDALLVLALSNPFIKLKL